MTTYFNYYDDWETSILECPRCGWRGTFKEGSMDWHRDLQESFCPNCSERYALAVVAYPTDEETVANLDRLSEEDRASFQARMERLARWERESLKSADELPELPGKTLVIIWDFEEDGTDRHTVLRHGDVVVWRELAWYEGYERFMEMLIILKARYGSRLIDVVPTPASEDYLFGDVLGAIKAVEEARRQLHETAS